MTKSFYYARLLPAPDLTVTVHNLLLLILAVILVYFSLPAQALKLPAPLKSCLQETLSISRIRLDGAVETKDGLLYLPLLPANKNNEKTIFLKASFPDQESPEFLLFSNGWCYLKVINTNGVQTVVLPDEMEAQLQKALLSTKFPSDLIVPQHFVLPSSLKPVASNIAVTFKTFSAKKLAAAQPEFAKMASATKEKSILSGEASSNENAEPADKNSPVNKDGCILVTSPATGKVSLLSFPDLAKIIEFPTEGTPSGIAFANGKVYIADQSKCRILTLDPYRKVFLGQIDLPKHSTPKDVVALPSGKLIYVSESLFNDVAVFEGNKDRLLLRTKVENYPGRMALTPNGNLLLIINVPSSKVSFVSTQNQRYLGVVKVGSLPNGIAISADNKMAYISNRVSNTISVIDLIHEAVINSINTGAGPTGLALDTDNNKLYVANAKDDSITIFNSKSYKKIRDIKLPVDLDFPGSLTLLPDKIHILVSSESTDTIGLLNISTGIFEKLAAVGHNTDLCLWIPAQE